VTTDAADAELRGDGSVLFVGVTVDDGVGLAPLDELPHAASALVSAAPASVKPATQRRLRPASKITAER
jgi:hypothetical protein